jgi:hypothetical protein
LPFPPAIAQSLWCLVPCIRRRTWGRHSPSPPLSVRLVIRRSLLITWR